MRLNMEIEKLEKAKSLLESAVYANLKKKISKQQWKEQNVLNDVNDIDIMDVIKKHQDHLNQLNSGLNDNHTWVLLRENEI